MKSASLTQPYEGHDRFHLVGSNGHVKRSVSISVLVRHFSSVSAESPDRVAGALRRRPHEAGAAAQVGVVNDLGPPHQNLHGLQGIGFHRVVKGSSTVRVLAVVPDGRTSFC